MMADHDMSRDKGCLAGQSDISPPFTTLLFHNLKGKFWYMEACQINVSTQNTVLICACLQPLLLTTLQNAKKKKKKNFNVAIEVTSTLPYANHILK